MKMKARVPRLGNMFGVPIMNPLSCLLQIKHFEWIPTPPQPFIRFTN